MLVVGPRFESGKQKPFVGSLVVYLVMLYSVIQVRSCADTSLPAIFELLANRLGNPVSRFQQFFFWQGFPVLGLDDKHLKQVLPHMMMICDVLVVYKRAMLPTVARRSRVPQPAHGFSFSWPIQGINNYLARPNPCNLCRVLWDCSNLLLADKECIDTRYIIMSFCFLS